MELAHRLDYGEYIESDTESKLANNDFVIKSKIADYENITQSEFPAHESLEIDFVVMQLRTRKL